MWQKRPPTRPSALTTTSSPPPPPPLSTPSPLHLPLFSLLRPLPSPNPPPPPSPSCLVFMCIVIANQYPAPQRLHRLQLLSKYWAFFWLGEGGALCERMLIRGQLPCHGRPHPPEGPAPHRRGLFVQSLTKKKKKRQLCRSPPTTTTTARLPPPFSLCSMV